MSPLLVSEHAPAMALAILVACLYLAILRAIDLHEKEPLWAIGLLFACGSGVAVFLSLAVSSTLLTLTVIPAALIEATAIAVAVGIGVSALAGVSRLRGWSELAGALDGAVYGAAAGLGFAAAKLLVRSLIAAADPLSDAAARLFATSFWTIAAAELPYGLYGAIVGAGFGAAVNASTPQARVGLVVAGWIGAVAAHATYIVLATGNALGGAAGVTRAWIALLLPAAILAAIAVVTLIGERQTIQRELASEDLSGAVTPADLAVLGNPLARLAASVSLLARGEIGQWAGSRVLRNRQVQLAMAKHRAARTPLPAATAEVDALRRAVIAMREALEGRS